jgi:DNA-binding MarR family transcriptional regulator
MSDESLETSKLLVEFLHATYATRRQDAGVAGGDGAGPNSKPAHPGDALATDHPMSAHAVRAAIHIYQHGVRTVGQLSSGLGISYGWASRVVDELEAAHFIVREPDPSDRRVVRVRLDEVALDRVERAYAWRGEAVSQALQPLTEAERTAVRTFLRRVIDLMREGDPNRVAEQAAPTDRSEPVQSPH